MHSDADFLLWQKSDCSLVLVKILSFLFHAQEVAAFLGEGFMSGELLIYILLFVFVYLCRFTIGDSVPNEPGRKHSSSLLVANFGLRVPLNLRCFSQCTGLGKWRG